MLNATTSKTSEITDRANAIAERWKKAVTRREIAWNAFQEAVEEERSARVQFNHLSQTSVHLTRRQQEVLQRVVDLKSNKEISNELNISERTVKFHVSVLLEIFNKQRRHELPGFRDRLL